MTWRDNRFAFIAREGEKCRLRSTGVFPRTEETGQPAFAFDGEKYYNQLNGLLSILPSMC